MFKGRLFLKYILLAISIMILAALGFIFKDNLVNEPADVIYKNCAQKMARNVCTIMNLEPNFSSEVKQIYLPEYGALNADTYRILLRSGPGMCQVVKDSCLKNLKSEVCMLGLVLYK